jgi:myo-inositol-1(or 4)-monophosphatase
MANGLRRQTEVAIEAAQQAGIVIMANFGKMRPIDQQVQEVIVKIIRKQFPDHDIWGEEGSDLSGNPFVWIIDPLDGTNNYLNLIFCFCTSIALQHNDDVILGVVYDPFCDKLFTSGDIDIYQVSGTENLTDAIIARARTLQSLGSAALSLCYVAAGWIDGFIHADIEPWDAAAGALIVQQAGGKVTDFEGKPWQTTSRQLIASNGLLHDELLAII